LYGSEEIELRVAAELYELFPPISSIGRSGNWRASRHSNVFV
jgi:hypothetical protein